MERTLPVAGDACECKVAFGFGSIWLLHTGGIGGVTRGYVERLDELSGRKLKTIAVPGDASDGTIATGNGAVWVLDNDGRLVRVDPSRTASAGRTRRRLETQILVPLAGYDWICQCQFGSLLRFDPHTHRSTTFPIPSTRTLSALTRLAVARLGCSTRTARR